MQVVSEPHGHHQLHLLIACFVPGISPLTPKQGVGVGGGGGVLLSLHLLSVANLRLMNIPGAGAGLIL